jgi:hypothetical protein
MTVVDNFGVNYVNKDDVEHLIASIKRIILLPRIGWETCTVGFNLIGIMKNKQFTYQCQDISEKNAGI